MIRSFYITDLDYFEPNEYSKPDDLLQLLSQYEVKTLWSERGAVKAIICFKNYWGRCWACFVLVATGFRPVDALFLRSVLRSYMDEHHAVRLQTESRADNILRKFHEFLGFTHEGTKRKMMFNQDYDCWAIVREGD